MMKHNWLCRMAAVLAPALFALPFLAGCAVPRRETSPVSEVRRDVQRDAAQTAQAPQPPTTAPSPPPAIAVKPEGADSNKLVPPAAEPAPEPTHPFEPPAPPAEPELPPYLQVIERIRPAEPAEVQVKTSSPQRLVIDTHNVRRLRIDREHAPLMLNGSVVLRLDGQGIEWTAGSRTREFERSVNGEWRPARERKP